MNIARLSTNITVIGVSIRIKKHQVVHHIHCKFNTALVCIIIIGVVEVGGKNGNSITAEAVSPLVHTLVGLQIKINWSPSHLLCLDLRYERQDPQCQSSEGFQSHIYSPR